MIKIYFLEGARVSQKAPNAKAGGNKNVTHTCTDASASASVAGEWSKRLATGMVGGVTLGV